MRTVGELGLFEPVFVFDGVAAGAARRDHKPAAERSEAVDYPDTPGAESPVIPLDGSVFSGTHSTSSDRDAIVFTITETTKIAVTYTHTASGYLSIYRWDGSASLRYAGWSSLNEIPLVIQLSPGTYYFDTGATDPGAYTISAILIDDDHPDTAPDAVSELVVGAAVQGTIDHLGDDDWFLVNVEAGQTIEFSVTGLNFGATLRLARVDPFGFGTFDLLTTDGDEPMRHHFTSGGTFQVGVQTSLSGFNFVGASYTISATEIPDPESDGPSTTATITPDGAAYLGEISHWADHDWIRLDLTSALPVQVSLENPAFSFILRIRDAAGNMIAATQSSSLIFQPPAAGTYFIEIQPAVLSPAQPNTYTLTAETLDDDFGSSPASAGAVTPGAPPIIGTVNFTGDADWFSVTSPVDQVIRIVAEGLGPYDFIPMMLLDVFDASGQLLHFIPRYFYQHPDVYVVSVLHIPAGQTVYVAPTGLPVGASYAITAAAVQDDQSGPPPVLPTDGTSVSGLFDYEGDVDSFLVTVGQDGVLVIRTPMGESPGAGMPYVPLLHTLDGARIYALNDGPVSDGAHWTMSYTGMPAGAYHVRMTPNSAATGAFSMSAQIVEDDYANLPGAPAALPGYGGRLTGSLDYGGDVDVIGINLIASGANYRFSFAPVNGSFTAPSIAFYAGNGPRHEGPPSTVGTPGINLIASFFTPGLNYIELGANTGAATGHDVVGDWVLNVVYLLSAGNDVLLASAHGDQIDGLAGDDMIQGLAGNDILMGGDGADTLSGGLGNDWLYGGPGSNKLHGGTGSDTFVIGNSLGTDTVSDFQPTWDRFEVIAASGAFSYADLRIVQHGADVLITFSNGGSVRLVNTPRELVGAHHFTFLGSASAEPTGGPAAAELADTGKPYLDLAPGHFEFARLDESGWDMA